MKAGSQSTRSDRCSTPATDRSRLLQRIAPAFALLLWAASTALAALPPAPHDFVTDAGGVLGPDRARALNAKLAAFERETSDQVLVWVDRRLPPDETIESFTNEAMHQWRVGQKGQSNGILFAVFVDDHKMRIEVGYGLEAVVTDAVSKRITSTVVKPHFARGDYPGGIEAGIDALLAAARKEPYRGSGKTAAQSSAKLAQAQLPSWVGCIIALLLLFVVVGVPVFIIIALVRRFRGRGGPPAATGSQGSTFGGGTTFGSSDSGSSSSSWSSSDSSSSSDSFSGGGGDSGGGGSSDSW
jgi:uncharacterized protein